MTQVLARRQRQRQPKKFYVLRDAIEIVNLDLDDHKLREAIEAKLVQYAKDGATKDVMVRFSQMLQQEAPEDCQQYVKVIADSAIGQIILKKSSDLHEQSRHHEVLARKASVRIGQYNAELEALEQQLPQLRRAGNMTEYQNVVRQLGVVANLLSTQQQRYEAESHRLLVAREKAHLLTDMTACN